MRVALARQSENTVVIRRVKIYFRQYAGPNRGGTAGAIASASYTLRTGDTTVPRPAPQQDCPPNFGNSDIFGGTYPDPTP